MPQRQHTEESHVEQVRERRKVLVVGKGEAFTQNVMEYALHLAERLDYDILALNIGDKPGDEVFFRKAEESAAMFRQRAEGRGVVCGHFVKFGDPGLAVEEVNHMVRRIELVVTDAAVNREAVAREVTVPMFSIISDSLEVNGGEAMEHEKAKQSEKKPVVQTIAYGLLSAALYAAVFMNSDTVMHYFTKGGIFAALPIATVFLFSFAHGAFASNLWSVLGIEAHKKEALRKVEQQVVEKRKQPAKKPRAYAYVNPFHRIDKY